MNMQHKIFAYLLCLVVVSFLVISIAGSCIKHSNEHQALRKLDKIEILDRIKNKQFSYAYASFKNQSGDKLDSLEQLALNKGEKAKDYYVDLEGTIKEVRVRDLNLEDKFLEIQIREFQLPDAFIRKNYFIDCSKLTNYLDALENHGTKLDYYDWDARAHFEEQENDIIYSIINQCGFPDKNYLSTESGLQLIKFLILGNTKTLAFYYELIQSLVLKGDLPPNVLAYVEDKLLSRHGFEQIYGTQMFRNGLAPVVDPLHLKYRREAIGLPPIDSSLIRINRTLEEEIKRWAIEKELSS